jgi:uncharacterized protein GlcG (DUF336 family)
LHELWVSIAVVDESTYVQHLVRMAGAPYTSADGAIEKARTAATAASRCGRTLATPIAPTH